MAHIPHVDASEPPRSMDFSARLHELRSSELQKLPPGAGRVLHGGASAGWYFHWFAENYPGVVDRHIGVEAFLERPGDLPQNVEWLKRTLGDLGPIPTGSVDMVFGGQVIEHLWAADVANFLSESHRVLRPEGILALDSPNRSVTEAIGWRHPQHTVEFSVDEIVLLTEVAGFEVEAVRGVLLGYDRTRHTFLNLEDDVMSWDERTSLATDRPESSFVWWLVARRAEHEPDKAQLLRLAGEMVDDFRARRIRVLSSPLSVRRSPGGIPWVSAPQGHVGLLLEGPCFPVDAGEWRASCVLRLEAARPTTQLPVASIEATSDSGVVVHAQRDVFAVDLDAGGAWTSVSLDIGLAEMVMGFDVRVFTHDQVPIGAQMTLGLCRPNEATRTFGSRRVYTPEPRTLEIIRMLGRRAVLKARHPSRWGAALARTRP
jgi:SAM-dependent methyltransferase